jgi:GNAT superfamily N-acetyltransferase
VIEVSLRDATAADVEALARAVVEGVADYRSFAPATWTPPTAAEEAEHLPALLADDRVRCLVAEAERSRIIGQVTVLPAAIAARPVDEPELAHLRNLLVDREFWGAGVARLLTAAAVTGARERGFTSMRLFVAEGQSRARRFYEREGWSPAGEPFFDPVPGLRLVEYRRAVR